MALGVFLQSINRLILVSRVAFDRVRAQVKRLGGSRIASKCLIGRGVRFELPEAVSLGRRVTLEPNVWLKATVPGAVIDIGEQSFLGRGTVVNVTERVTIGALCLIAPDVFITDHNHRIGRSTPIVTQGCESRPVTIESDVWIGTRSVILPGVTVGQGAVIGAGAVVTKSVPAYEIWAGVPARKIGER